MSLRPIPDTVRRRQAEASDPSSAAFVAANAGSGKTHVLAQRVIRLMLDGGPAGSIRRAFSASPSPRRRRPTWRRGSTTGCGAGSRSTTRRSMRPWPRSGSRRSTSASGRARDRLFAAALETPGGLKIQTIHAFCTRLLQQFPFEADRRGAFHRAGGARPERDARARDARRPARGGRRAGERARRRPQGRGRGRGGHHGTRRNAARRSASAKSWRTGSMPQAVSRRRSRNSPWRSGSLPMTISPRREDDHRRAPSAVRAMGRHRRRVRGKHQTDRQDPGRALDGGRAASSAAAGGRISQGLLHQREAAAQVARHRDPRRRSIPTWRSCSSPSRIA